MSLDYNKVWKSLNELESVTSKICSARGILESALDALENHKYDKAETLMYAVDEYLQYYLEDFDRKFKDAWAETVMKVNEQEYSVDPAGNYVNTPWSYNNEDVITFNISDTMNNDWEGYYYPEENSYLANDLLTQDRTSNFPGEQYTDEVLKAMCDKSEADHNMPPWGHSDMEALSKQKEDKVVRWQLPVDKIENGDTGEDEYFITFPDDLLEAANLKPGDEVLWEDKNDGTFILRKVTKPLGMDEC
jgi:hypothetical protein